jgi:hypothetical protein
VVYRIRRNLQNRLKGIRIRPRGQQAVAAGQEGCRNPADVLNAFPFAENHFREPVPFFAGMVHLGEPEILESIVFRLPHRCGACAFHRAERVVGGDLPPL